jgi:hypothetical protein
MKSCLPEAKKKARDERYVSCVCKVVTPVAGLRFSCHHPCTICVMRPAQSSQKIMKKACLRVEKNALMYTSSARDYNDLDERRYNG